MRPSSQRAAAPSDELTLELTRVLPAARSVVFGSFSDPTQLAEWWGPEGFTTPSLWFQPRVGGATGSRCSRRRRPFYLAGQFRELEPPTRLAYTFVWEDPDPDDVQTMVGLSFRDLGEATAVALTQGPFRTEARRALHRDGWTDSLDKLEHLLFVRT